MIISIYLRIIEEPTQNRSAIKVTTYPCTNLYKTKLTTLCIGMGSLTNIKALEVIHNSNLETKKGNEA